MKIVTKYYLSNPYSGAPIHSNGVDLEVGEDMEISKPVGEELVRRYAFLSLSSKDVKVKTKKVKKDKVEKVEVDEMSLEGLSALAEKVGVAPSKIEKVLIKRLIVALPREHKEEKELAKRMEKELTRIEKIEAIAEKKAVAEAKKGAKKKK